MNGLTDGWMDRLTDRLRERGREGVILCTVMSHLLPRLRMWDHC